MAKAPCGEHEGPVAVAPADGREEGSGRVMQGWSDRSVRLLGLLLVAALAALVRWLT